MSDVTPPPFGQLIMAVRSLDIVLVEKLLAEKADPNEKDEAGMTALMYAAREKPMKQLTTYSPLYDNSLPTILNPDLSENSINLHKSLELRIADKLIDAGANIDALDDNGFNALFYAMQNNLGILKLLIINHARLDVETSFGTALECAKNENLTEAVTLLAEAELVEYYLQRAAAVRPTIAMQQDLIRSQRPPITVRRRPAP